VEDQVEEEVGATIAAEVDLNADLEIGTAKIVTSVTLPAVMSASSVVFLNRALLQSNC